MAAEQLLQALDHCQRHFGAFERKRQGCTDQIRDHQGQRHLHLSEKMATRHLEPLAMVLLAAAGPSTWACDPKLQLSLIHI